MADPAVDIIDEYVASGSPQVRKNAHTALEALHTPESLSRLVAAALRERQRDVRSHAEELIAKLGPLAHEPVADVIGAALAVDESRDAAYDMFGRLAGRGLNPPLDPPLWRRFGLLHRLTLAFGYVLRTNPWMYPPFWMRPLAVSFAVGLVASFAWVCCLYTYTAAAGAGRLDAGFAFAIFFVAVAASVVVSCAATLFTIPINLHCDRPVGLAADLAAVCAFGTAAAWLLDYLISTSALLPGVRPEPLIYSPAVAGLPIYLMSVRLGTLLALGVFRDPWRNRWTQVFVGGCAGALSASCITALILSMPAVVADTFKQIVAVFWLILVPTGFGIASAFAFVDKNAPIVTTIFPRLLSKASLAVPIVTYMLLTLVLLAPLYHRWSVRPSSGTSVATISSNGQAKDGQVREVSLPNVPAVINLELKSAQAFRVDMVRGLDDALLGFRLNGPGSLDYNYFRLGERAPHGLYSEFTPGKYEVLIDRLDFVQDSRALLEPSEIFLGMIRRLYWPHMRDVTVKFTFGLPTSF
jgi:hypothetical protein